MVNEKLISVLTDRILSATKVVVLKNERPEDIVKDTLITIFDGIDSINALSENAVMINGEYLDKVFIINEFKEFIYPASVKFNPADFNSVDMLERPSDTKSFDTEAFINAQLKLRSWFRSDVKSNTSLISDLRKKVSLFDVLPMASFRENRIAKCSYMDKPYVPIPLKKDLSIIFRTTFFNSTVDYILEDFTSDLFR